MFTRKTFTKLIVCTIAAVCWSYSSWAALFYSFEDSLDGWDNVDTSSTSGGPTKFGFYDKAYFQANYDDPRGSGDSRINPSDGDYILTADPFGDHDTKTRDNAHETLVVRSPEFNIFEEGKISAYIYGGAGSGSLVANYDNLPTDSYSSGYLGLALRNVDTNEYEIDFHKSSSSDDGFYVELSGTDIQPFVSQTQKYTLDLIDYREENWAWVGVDSVSIESGVIPEPTSFQMIILVLVGRLLIRRRR